MVSVCTTEMLSFLFRNRAAAVFSKVCKFTSIANVVLHVTRLYTQNRNHLILFTHETLQNTELTILVRFEVLRAMVKESYIFWDITPYSLLKVNIRFHLFSRWFLARLILRP
jgi:hypothetical protein